MNTKTDNVRIAAEVAETYFTISVMKSLADKKPDPQHLNLPTMQALDKAFGKMFRNERGEKQYPATLGKLRQMIDTTARFNIEKDVLSIPLPKGYDPALRSNAVDAALQAAQEAITDKHLKKVHEGIARRNDPAYFVQDEYLGLPTLPVSYDAERLTGAMIGRIKREVAAEMKPVIPAQLEPSLFTASLTQQFATLHLPDDSVVGKKVIDKLIDIPVPERAKHANATKAELDPSLDAREYPVVLPPHVMAKLDAEPVSSFPSELPHVKVRAHSKPAHAIADDPDEARRKIWKDLAESDQSRRGFFGR